MAVADLTIERLKRETDNTKVSVRDLLAAALHAVESGELEGEAARVLVLIEVVTPQGPNVMESFRAGCTRYEEIALLRLHEHRQIELWRQS